MRDQRTLCMCRQLLGRKKLFQGPQEIYFHSFLFSIFGWLADILFLKTASTRLAGWLAGSIYLFGSKSLDSKEPFFKLIYLYTYNRESTKICSLYLHFWTHLLQIKTL